MSEHGEYPQDAAGEHQRHIETVYSLRLPTEAEKLHRGEALPPEQILAGTKWGNDLIDVWAERNSYTGPYKPGMRSERLFAWPDPLAIEEATRIAPDRVPVALQVDADTALVADLGTHPPVGHRDWAKAQFALAEAGINLEEYLGDGSARVSTKQGSAIKVMPPDFQQRLLDYFDPPIRAYVESFQTLAQLKAEPKPGNWEVLVPRNDIMAAAPVDEEEVE